MRRVSGCARFEDLDGEWATFHLHARFTPGAGRIHFRLVGEACRIRIAHVGGRSARICDPAQSGASLLANSCI